jgi:hypothetical protein
MAPQLKKEVMHRGKTRSTIDDETLEHTDKQEGKARQILP